MMATPEETTTAHLPRLSNDNQLKIFKLVKAGCPIDEALQRAEDLATEDLNPEASTSAHLTTDVSEAPGATSPGWRSKIGFFRSSNHNKKNSQEDSSEGANAPLSDLWQTTCIVCGSKLAVVQPAISVKQYRAHAACIDNKKAMFENSITPMEACQGTPHVIEIAFFFLGHEATYRFMSSKQPVQLDTIDETKSEYVNLPSDTSPGAEITYLPIMGDKDYPHGQLWPSLIAGFGLPHGLTLSLSGSFDIFKHDGEFKNLAPAERSFSAELSARIFGYLHKLLVSMKYEEDGCKVTAGSIVLQVLPELEPMSDDEFGALCADNVSELTQEDFDISHSPRTPVASPRTQRKDQLTPHNSPPTDSVEDI